MPTLKKVEVKTVYTERTGGICIESYDGYASLENGIVYWVEMGYLMMNKYIFCNVDHSYQTNCDTDIYVAGLVNPEKFDLTRATAWHRKLQSASLVDFILSNPESEGRFNNEGNEIGRFIMDSNDDAAKERLRGAW